MTNTPRSISRAVAAALLTLAGPVMAGQVDNLQVLADDRQVEIRLDSEVGTVTRSGVTRDGRYFVVELSDIGPDRLGSLLARLPAPGGLVAGVTAQPLGAAGARLIVSLSDRAAILREEIVSTGRSSVQKTVALGRVSAPFDLEGASAREEGGRLLIELAGAESLSAKARQQGEASLVLDLEQVSEARARRALGGLSGQAGWVRSVQVAPTPSGSRATLTFGVPVELVDSSRAGLSAGKSQLRLVLAKQPPLDAQGVAGSSVAGFASRIVDGGGTVVVLEPRNVEVSLAEGSASNELRIRLRGVNAARAAELASAFRPANPDVLGATVVSGDARSAVVAFQLARPASGVARVEQVADLGVVVRFADAPDNAGGRAAERSAPVASAPAAAVTGSAPVPMAARPVVGAAPAGEARPMILEKPSGQTAAVVVPVGRDLTLAEGLKLAEQNDSKLAAARREFEAQAEAVPQALAGIRPSIAIDAQAAANDQRVRPLSGAATTRDFSGRDLGITITQPLFRQGAWTQLRQSEKAVEQARVALEATQQELLLRYVGAYLNVLAGQDSVALARAEREALEKQLQLVQTRLKSGLANVTEVSDTEGRYSISRAREIEAANNLQDARMALREIVGVEVATLSAAVSDFSPVAPTPVDPGAWQEAARRQNLALQLRDMARGIAEIEIEKQQAAYKPTVDLVASSNRGRRGDFASGSTFTGGFESTNSSLGVRLNMPLYQGGMTDSLVREAVARRDKAREEFNAEQRRVERAASQSLLALQTSSSMIGALRKSVEAQQTALEAKLKGLESGLFTAVQVADAYRLLFAANRDFLQARYDYLLNRIKLQQSIGVLSARDVDDIALLLTK